MGTIKLLLDEEYFEEKFKKSMKGIGFDLQNSMQDKLTQEHGKDTGELQSSITYKIQGELINFEMAEHAPYLEWGTPPHFPPPEELEGWVKRKLGANDEKERKRLAYLLAYSISRRGTRPYPFIRPTFYNEGSDIVVRNFKFSF